MISQWIWILIRLLDNPFELHDEISAVVDPKYHRTFKLQDDLKEILTTISFSKYSFKQ